MKSWIEVSGARLAENYRATEAVVGDDVDVLAVIKADGYGHGAAMCAHPLVGAGAGWLGVTDVEEGCAVRSVLGQSPIRILVMCGMEVRDAAAMIEHWLTPVIWTVEQVRALDAAAALMGESVDVHVEVDTGMSRQGAAAGQELQNVLVAITASEWVRCEGIMTHLCCAEVAGAETTLAARERFAAALAQVAAIGLHPTLVHMSNTSAVDEGSTIAWVKQQAQVMQARAMVRTGIALFGHCLPLESTALAPALRGKLQPAMTWKAPVIGVRNVPAGATVGYGANFTAERPMRLALLPVGYADGFRREASSGMGNGWVMIHAQRAPVIGRVSMNLTVVDVSGIAGVEAGAEAVLLGEGVSAEDHARWADTIPYDILCGVRGKRKLV